MKKKKTPEILNFSTTEFDALKSRVTTGRLLDGDTKILLSVLSTYQWLSRQLQSTKLTIHRLKKIFGFTTEQRISLKQPKQEESTGLSEADEAVPSNNKPGNEVPETKKL